jgi:hypothetical protein
MEGHGCLAGLRAVDFDRGIEQGIAGGVLANVQASDLRTHLGGLDLSEEADQLFQ